MDTIDISKINDNDSLYVCDKKKLENAFSLNNISSKEITASSINELLYLLDQQIKTISFDIGMDKFLLKKGGFKSGEYFKIIEEYRSLYKNNQINEREILFDTYNYLISCLKTCVLLKIDEEFNIKSINIKLVVDNNDDNILPIIVKIYEKARKENPNINFVYLDKFINYINNYELGFSLKM